MGATPALDEYTDLHYNGSTTAYRVDHHLRHFSPPLVAEATV